MTNQHKVGQIYEMEEKSYNQVANFFLINENLRGDMQKTLMSSIFMEVCEQQTHNVNCVVISKAQLTNERRFSGLIKPNWNF